MIRDKFLHNIAKQIEGLAISKEELTPANVEPFRMELNNYKPCFEKPMRYNRKLTNFIDEEV